MMRIDPWRVGPAPASRPRIARRRDRIGLAPYARRRGRAMTTRSPPSVILSKGTPVHTALISVL
jgi:hypothetical protein